MSNIWHDKKEKPTKKLHCNRLIITKWGSCLDETDIDNGATIETDWAYLDDLLALETELARTRKELDIRKKQVEIANKAFDFISAEWDNVDCSRKELGACAFNAKEDITGWESDIETALEQKDVK